MKLFDDTLKNNGKYNYRKLTVFWSFVMMNLIGIYILASDYILPKGRELNRFVGDVFWGFLVGALGSAAANIADKYSARNKDGKRYEGEEVG